MTTWNDKRVLVKIRRKILDKLETVGELVESSAKLNLEESHAVNSGKLVGSINHKVDKSDLSVTISTGVGDYAAYVEFGTGEFAENGKGRKGGWVYFVSSGEEGEGKYYFTMGMKPRPYLRPALIENKESIERILAI